MRKALLIAKRDYLISVSSKTFLIGLIIFPLLFGGSLLGVAVMKAKPDMRDRRVALLDRTGKVAALVVEAGNHKNARDVFDKKTGLQISPRYVIEPVAVDPGDARMQRLALSERIRNGELFAFIDVSADALPAPADATQQHAAANAPVTCYTNAGAIDRVDTWLAAVVNDGLRAERLREAGLDAALAPALLAAVPMDRLDLLVRDPRTGAIVEPVKRDALAVFAIPFGIMLLLAMIVMIGSLPMLGAITEDKSQRVVEMLLGVASPFDIMMGKVLAGVGRALTSSILYVGVATVSLLAMNLSGVIPFSVLPWFYVYLLADVALLCALSAALGAACNNPQEAQNLAMLVLTPVIVPLFLLLPIVNKPNGAFATAMSLFPPFTPLVMLLRQSLPGGVPAWQPWVGLIGVAAFSALGIWAAARIFRVAILMQGKPPRLADMARWALKG